MRSFPLRTAAVVLAAALLSQGALQPPAAARSTIDPTSALQWRYIGPARGGRTVAVAGVPSQPNLYYIAAVNGGIWKSDDYGRTWVPVFDGQPTQSIGALAVAPSDPNVIYAGSGEGLRRPDLAVGDGMYKSTDAGKTWTHLGLRDGQQINGIAVDPRDPNRLFVAVVGHPYGPNPERGLYRSTDGGASFQRVLGNDSDTGAVAVEIDPNAPDTVYAALWLSRRPPWTTGDPLQIWKGALYKSTDGGSTWSKVITGMPARIGRIGFDIARSDSSRLYAVVDSPDGCGIYRSNDAAATWTRTNTEGRVCGRGSDFAGITADPVDENEVYVANTSTYRSTNGGSTFVAIKGAPGGDDYHTVWINPLNHNLIFLGSDQGATLSVNDGRTWSSWYNQPTAQMYHVTADNRFPYWVCSGQQESGTACVRTRGDMGEITMREWHPVGGEEYGYVAPDPLHPGIFFAGKASRFDERTSQFQDVSPVIGRNADYRFDRTAPLIFNPVDPHILYLGSSVVFATRDGGMHWKVISPDLTRPNPGTPSKLGAFANQDPRKGQHRGVVYALSPSYVDKDTIWAGTDDGLVWVTHDQGAHWKNVSPQLTAWSKVAQIDSSHFDNHSAYVAVNRFRLDDLHPYIYRTHDDGKTWTPIVNGLPNAPVNAVREDPVRRGLLYASTETGVDVSFDDGDHWQSLTRNLPPTSVRDIIVHGDDLAVGTHGRGFWILDDVEPLREYASAIGTQALHLFAPASAYRVRRSLGNDTPLPPEEPMGQNPPDGAIFDYSLARDVTHVSITISDMAGRMIRRFQSDDPAQAEIPGLDKPTYWERVPSNPQTSAGMHRFVWDLHGTTPRTMNVDLSFGAVPHDTPHEPLGTYVPPGRYTVRVVADGAAQTRTFTVRPDPRVNASVGTLRGVAAISDHLVDLLDRTFAAAARAHARNNDTVASGFARLNGQLQAIYAVIEGVDAQPTATALAAYERLRREAETALANGKPSHSSGG